MRRSSARYLHANAIVGVVVAFAALAASLYADHEFGLATILVDPFVLGGLAAATVQLCCPRSSARCSRRRAHAAPSFAARARRCVERGVHATTGRSGVLVYISWLEREVALVADLGLVRALADGTLATAEQGALSAAQQCGSAAPRSPAGQRQLAPRMAIAMAHSDDDVNELPDAVDSEERGRRRRS